MRLFVLVMLVLATLLGVGCTQPIQPTLEIAPDSATLVTGREVQLTVTRRFPGGQADDVTARVTYTSSNRNVLGVTSAGRLIPGQESGSSVVRVTDPTSDAFGVAVFTVVPPRVESIDVIPSPAIVLVPGSGGRQFDARAKFTDGVTRDITKFVQWSSSNEAAARVGRTPADNGVVYPVKDGDTIIIARDGETGVEGRTTVFVRGNAPHLVAVTIEPNPAAVAVGKTVQLTAIGVYSDGTLSSAITATAQWASSDETKLKVDATGLATGIAAGDVTISAVESGVRGSAAAKVQ